MKKLPDTGESGEAYDAEQHDGGEATPRTHHFTRPSLLAIGVMLSLALSGVTFLHASSIIPFPGSQLFSLTVQYTAGSPSSTSGTFTAGSSVNVILTLVNNGNAGTVNLQYNSTNPTQFSAQDVNSGCASGSNGQCSNPLSMTDSNGRIFAPTNSPLCGPDLCFSTQTAAHGTNTFTMVLSASQTAQLQSFSLFWQVAPQ